MRATVRVRSGDSLWGIAKRFGVEVSDLCRWNGIKNPSSAKILIGQRLVVYPRTAVGEPAQKGGRGPGEPPAAPAATSGVGRSLISSTARKGSITVTPFVPTPRMNTSTGAHVGTASSQLHQGVHS